MKNYRIVSLLLALMLLVGCAAKGAEPAPEAVPAAEDVISVATVDELIAAVAPGAVIELSEGTKVLSYSSSYGGETGSEYCRWVDTYDGFELEIHDVEGLTIRGTGREASVLSAEPRYANVLVFRRCADLTVQDLTAGHTMAEGWCSGGVLLFADCENVRIERCGLYGCGTIGVWCDDCRNVSVRDTDIYECSYNAVSVSSCQDVCVDRCRVYSCGVKDSGPAINLFESWNTGRFIVTSCEVFDNVSSALFRADHSRNAALLSCDVHDNRFEDAVFSLFGSAAAVDGCEWGTNRFLRWAWELYPTNAAGEALTDEALEAMTFREIDPASLTLVSAVPTEVAPGGEVRVTNVDELLAAIGPERTIVLAPGTYDLAEAADYGGPGGEFYYWQENYDGPGLVIEGAKNLTLLAEDEDASHTVITAAPRYANVLAFRRCEDLTLKGLTLGHTLAPGDCSGGVVDLWSCSGTNLQFCRLYGCGICGVNAYDGAALSVIDCEIFDCSWCAANISGYDGVTFKGCDIHDVPSPALYLDGCADVVWNGEAVDAEAYSFDVADGALTPFTWPDTPAYDPSIGNYVAFQAGSDELSFALLVQGAFANGDWAALAELASYPLRINTPTGSYVFSSREDMLSPVLDELLTADFRQSVACAGLDSYRQTAGGSIFANGALAFEHFPTAEGDRLRITVIATDYSL